jgi:ATP-dependent DNA helicase RecG
MFRAKNGWRGNQMAYTYSDLEKWVGEWEGPAMEFKASVQEGIGKTISAFANTYGGIIVFGVGPKKELKGLANPDEESKRLRQVLDNCKPYPNPEQDFIKHDGKTFIVLKLEPFSYSKNPCFYGDLCHIRQGTTNLKLTGDDLIEFLKNRAILNYEESKSKATLKDLDLGKLNHFLVKRGIGISSIKADNYKNVLFRLGAANYNGDFFLKNVALFFFAKEPQKFFNNLEVRIVKYAGSEPELGIIKFDKKIYGTLPELINQSFNLAIEHVGKTLTLAGPERKEVPEYPTGALRELITNSIGHRDYFQAKEVLIEIFEDRLQITNPGGLMAGQNIKNFDRTPQHRNPITYRLLRDFGLGEGLGLGVRLIRKQCREARLPDPEFYAIGNAFQAVLYNRSSAKKKHLPDFVNRRQKQLLAYLQRNKSIKSEQYAKMVDISKPTAVTDLNELIKQGKIRKVGKYRGAYYEWET